MPEIKHGEPHLGPLDYFTFYPAPPPPLGFHQMVISSRLGPPIHADGTYDLIWRGATGSEAGGISVQTPPVIQDTDGYTGTPGNMQFGGPPITTWTIPAGRAGDYEIGWEQFPVISGHDPWWDYAHSQPLAVPYVYYGWQNGFGAEIAAGPVRVDMNFLVNGVVVANVFTTANRGSGTYYWAPVVNLPPTRINGLHVGDVMKCQSIWSGPGKNFFNAVGASYGNIVYGVQQGVLIMRQIA